MNNAEVINRAQAAHIQLVRFIYCDHGGVTRAKAMGDLMRRSYLGVQRSEEKAFAEQDIDFEIRNHFYKF
jgi:hypothetical protein